MGATLTCCGPGHHCHCDCVGRQLNWKYSRLEGLSAAFSKALRAAGGIRPTYLRFKIFFCSSITYPFHSFVHNRKQLRDILCHLFTVNYLFFYVSIYLIELKPFNCLNVIIVLKQLILLLELNFNNKVIIDLKIFFSQ